MLCKILILMTRISVICFICIFTFEQITEIWRKKTVISGVISLDLFVWNIVICMYQCTYTDSVTNRANLRYRTCLLHSYRYIPYMRLIPSHICRTEPASVDCCILLSFYVNINIVISFFNR